MRHRLRGSIDDAATGAEKVRRTASGAPTDGVSTVEALVNGKTVTTTDILSTAPA